MSENRESSRKFAKSMAGNLTCIRIRYRRISRCTESPLTPLHPLCEFTLIRALADLNLVHKSLQ